MMVELRSGYEVVVFPITPGVERLLWHRKEGACSIDEEETLMGKKMGAAFLFSWIIIEAFCAHIRHLRWNLRENTVKFMLYKEGRSLQGNSGSLTHS